jgi:hypothetical protein
MPSGNTLSLCRQQDRYQSRKIGRNLPAHLRFPLPPLLSRTLYFYLPQSDRRIDVLRSFVGVVALYIRMLRNLPSVSAVFHESVTAKVFHDIGAELGVDLSSALHYYDSSRARHYTLNDIPEEAWESTKAVVDLYENLRQHALSGFESVQLEQNSGHLDIRHYTPIGALQRQVEQLLRQL